MNAGGRGVLDTACLLGSGTYRSRAQCPENLSQVTPLDGDTEPSHYFHRIVKGIDRITVLLKKDS